MPWGANQLRLTAFPDPSAVIRTPDWWAQVTGQPADQTANNVKQSIFEASGAFGDGVLTLRTQPLRIDWLFTPSMSEDLPAPDASLGPLQTAIDQFGPVADRWFALPDSPNLVRLAFSTVLLDPVESRQAGYRRLGEFLPDVRLDEDSSDFSYQINRPRHSAVIRDLMLNGLSKWSVGAVQAFVANEMGIALAERQYRCRVETDVNSTPEFGRPLPRAELGALFRECVGLTSEIAARGDIR